MISFKTKEGDAKEAVVEWKIKVILVFININYHMSQEKKEKVSYEGYENKNIRPIEILHHEWCKKEGRDTSQRSRMFYWNQKD